MRLSYAIVFVSDMKRSTAFYRDIIGLPLKFESPEWTEFATGAATLALHLTNLPPAGGDPKVHAGGSCRPGLTVENIDAFHQRMVQHGVQCLEAPHDVHGTRLAQYADPDGMSISIGEERKPQ